MIALSGLFLAAFLAATPVPFQSEPVFLGFQAAGWGTGLLVLVASVGNTLGSCVTYALGRWLADQRDHRWFPLSPPQLARAERWFARWGLWLLLLSWAPFGDMIVAVSGVLRVPVPVFLVLVAVAKTGRYIALGWLGAVAFGR
ncbi:VTT domain-containing protein [Tabrizicola sp.]|uniref:YqaA family protein n=1 Tax=Tabrizicola sp. TaxID=2005166 RepID=UPI001A487901|nr:VTT domain-containing protein [Tabrizicola sp.]MBL9073802.1 DedA family protein [Tabrizicola sp.]